MSESSRRAVLLARPGAACERLRSALADSGAQLVLEADPTVIDLNALGAAAPQVVVVALDPVTEDAIERFDPVLGDPAVEVIYEEAALAASREGWDLARWVRHLAAKLQGHGDVLPPGHEPEGEAGEAVQTSAAAAFVPAVDAPAPVAKPLEAPAPVAAAPVAAVPVVATPIVATPVVATPVVATPVVAPVAPPVSATSESGYSPFDPVAAEQHYERPSLATSVPPLMEVEELAAIDMPLVDEQTLVSVDADALVIEPFESSFDFEIEPPSAAPAVREPVAEPVLLFESAHKFEVAAVDDVAPVEKPVVDAPLAPDWSFAEDGNATTAGKVHAVSEKFQRDLGELENRISSLELVEDRPTVHNNGAVLVVAGIGGPDAVRQLLSALPDTFPRPVLVQQRLDGGRHDRLVAQMQRATPLQVRLAEPGLIAMPGSIYILPAAIGLSVSESGIRFTEGDGDVMASLPSADSAVLLLSGSDTALVDAALNHSWAGALVAGQAPDGCYDAAASSALIARGGASGQPVDLAARLAQRWP